MDKGSATDECDCRLTLAVWTIAELIRLMNVEGGTVTDAFERRGEERAGQTDIFVDGGK